MTTNPDNFSVIVPTYREASNVTELINRLAQLDFSPRVFEVIFVDDNSQDGIDEVIAALQATYPWLRLIIRQNQKSLSASAIEGFQQARFPLLVLMDADLSHPPEKIPALLTALKNTEVDFVIGSRYIPGGKTDKRWPITRKLSSRLAAWLAQGLISKRVQDPLSGFFALKKTTLLRSDPLKPVGWKIGLELMVKCRCRHIEEIPIYFSERLSGKSKFNINVMYEYGCHLKQLLFYKLRRSLGRKAL